jgi:hypothetical protein
VVESFVVMGLEWGGLGRKFEPTSLIICSSYLSD